MTCAQDRLALQPLAGGGATCPCVTTQVCCVFLYCDGGTEGRGTRLRAGIPSAFLRYLGSWAQRWRLEVVASPLPAGECNLNSMQNFAWNRSKRLCVYVRGGAPFRDSGELEPWNRRRWLAYGWLKRTAMCNTYSRRQCRLRLRRVTRETQHNADTRSQRPAASAQTYSRIGSCLQP